jgi:hypothetical protein
VLPLLERTGIAWPWKTIPRPLPMKILWLIDKINHPLVGACVDTVNSMGVLENPETAVKKLAPYAFATISATTSSTGTSSASGSTGWH